MKNSLIKTKIIITLILVTVLTALLIGTTSYAVFRSVLTKQAGEYGIVSAKHNAEIIEAWAIEKKASIERTAEHLSALGSHDPKVIRDMLNVAALADPSFYSVFIGLDDGRLIDAKDWIPSLSYDVKSRPWYQQAMAANDTVFTPVYMDKNKMSLVTSIALPIHIQDHKGVIAANLPMDQVLLVLDSIKFGDTGYGILIDDLGTIIAHRDKDNVLKRLDNAVSGIDKKTVNTILENRQGVETIRFEDEELILVYAAVPACSWKLILLAPISEFLTPVHDMAGKLIIILAFTLIFMAIIGMLLARTISEPIEKIIRYIQKLSRGDFSEQIEVTGAAELGTLSTAINHMRDNHAEVIRSIRKDVRLLHNQAQKLTESIDDISTGVTDFVSELSHDIKTPLTLVKGYTKGLQVGITDDPEKVNAYLAGIYARSEHIERITEDILDSIYDARKMPVLESESVSIEELSNMLFANAEWQIGNSKRIFNGKVSVSGGNVICDRSKLTRVWDNLITNAIKYSEEGSTIETGIEQTSTDLICWIKDEGIGIKAEDLEKIFDMFYRTKEKEVKGYGIGLAISKAIVEAHGGTITVESLTGKGSKLTFNIPI